MKQPQDESFKYVPLFESWQIDEKIGEGSYGVVYKVSKREMGETYDSAMKVISVPTKEQYREAESSFGGDERALTEYFEDIVKNIIREIKMLYSLGGNANIIGYQDHKVIKREDGIGWEILIRMEYVNSLRKYLKEHAMTREDAIKLGIDICTALEMCSKKGIVHRDIKDDNIFVSDDGVFKLGDFGIARELSKSGHAASMRGTPLYMAPEVVRGEKYDAAVDIYSLGIVLYKLLNHGRMPFIPPFPLPFLYADNEDAFERRISGEPLPPPDMATKSLGEIILKACAFRPEQRYTSAAELKAALEGYLTSMSAAERLERITPETSKKEEETEPAAAEPIPAANREQAGKPGERTVGVFDSSSFSSGGGAGAFEEQGRTYRIYEEADQSASPTQSGPYDRTKTHTPYYANTPFYNEPVAKKEDPDKHKSRTGWIIAASVLTMIVIAVIVSVSGANSAPAPSAYVYEDSSTSNTQQQTNDTYSGGTNTQQTNEAPIQYPDPVTKTLGFNQYYQCSVRDFNLDYSISESEVTWSNPYGSPGLTCNQQGYIHAGNTQFSPSQGYNTAVVVQGTTSNGTVLQYNIQIGDGKTYTIYRSDKVLDMKRGKTYPYICTPQIADCLGFTMTFRYDLDYGDYAKNTWEVWIKENGDTWTKVSEIQVYKGEQKDYEIRFGGVKTFSEIAVQRPVDYSDKVQTDSLSLTNILFN